MEELTQKKKIQVIRLYFCGQPFEQIAVKTGIAKGSVSNVVAELKGGLFPETADLTEQLEGLRELSGLLNKLKKTPAESLVGLAVLNRIFELGLDPADMEKWPLILNSIKTQDDASQLIEAAYQVRELQQTTGLSLPALEEKVKRLGKQASALEETNKKISLAKEQLQGLAAKVNEYTQKVGDLEEKLNWLTPRVAELHQREQTLLASTKQINLDAEDAKEVIAIFNAETKKLEKAGLSIEVLPDFAKKLEVVAKHHGLKAAAVRNRLLQELKLLDKFLSLEALVKAQSRQLKETNQAITKSQAQKATLDTVVAALVQQKQDIENIIQALTAAVVSEIIKLTPVVKDTSEVIAETLKNGCTDALAEVHHLQEVSIAVGQEVGQYQGILAQSGWIKKLLAVMEGGGEVSPVDVRSLALMINQGLYTWFKLNRDRIPNILYLDMHIRNYIQELENWKIAK